MKIPKLGDGRSKFKVPAKTFKTGLVGESFRKQVQVFFECAVRRCANVQFFALSAFFAADFDSHQSL